MAGVSVTTASHALNKTRFVQPDTAERVFRAARELGYSVNSVARGLRTGTSRTIGVIGHSALDPFFAEVVVGIEHECYNRGYDVYLGFVEYPHGCTYSGSVKNFEREEEFLRAVLSGRFDAAHPFDAPEKPDIFEKEKALVAKLLSRDVDGMVIHPAASDPAVEEVLAGIKPKLALFHRTIKGVEADVFVSDDYAGTLSALQRLLALGHRRIGMVYGFSWEGHEVRERFRAYRDALAAAGISPDTSIMANGAYELDAAAEATRRLLSRADPPTAILYWSDPMAIAGMDAAREAGASVPRDLSIIGFDDLPLASRVSPRLSSIRQETVGMGESMARRLIDRIEGKLEDQYGRIVSPATYVERESVAARA